MIGSAQYDSAGSRERTGDMTREPDLSSAPCSPCDGIETVQNKDDEELGARSFHG